jgi:hypothetical protein
MVVEAGLPDGDAFGAVEGLTEAAGAGVADVGVTFVLGSHAAETATTAKTVSRKDLPIIVFFICIWSEPSYCRWFDRLQPRGSFSRSSLYSGPAIRFVPLMTKAQRGRSTAI